MAKFKVKVAVEKLLIEIEGDRGDIPLIAGNVGHAFANLVEPASSIVEGELHVSRVDRHLPALAPDGKPAPRRRPRRQINSAAVSVDGSALVDLSPDPERFGTPIQDWTTAIKSMWLLYVVQESSSQKELTSVQIVATFNQHFRQCGQIHLKHVTRDLGRQKVKGPNLIGENTNVNPSTWYLTTAGIENAKTLVANAIGQVAA